MAIKAVPTYGKVPKSASYLSYTGQTPSSKPYVPVKYTPGYGPGEVPSSAGYVTYGGQTPESSPPYVPPPPDTTSTSSTSSAPSAPSAPPTDTTSSTPEIPSLGDLSPTLAEIYADPVYGLAKEQSDTGDATAARARAAAINALIASGGYDLSKYLGTYTGDIDPTALAVAKTNPFSARGQLEMAYNTGQKALLYEMAAKNTLGGGAQASGLTGLLRTQQLGEFNYLSGAQKSVNDIISAYVNSKAAGLTNLQQTINDIAARLAQEKGAIYAAKAAAVSPASTAPGDDGSQGQDVINLWDNPYQPEGVITAPGEITAPGGGTYRESGGDVYYQSNKGKYGKKPLF